MTDIDERLRGYYRGLELNKTVLHELVDASNKASGTKHNRQFWPARGLVWGAAALLVLSLSIGIHDYGTQSERTLRTLNEAAMNHSTRLTLEFEADNIRDIDKSMSQLQFTIALPTQFNDQFNIVGARYCTINGELAAHVKLIDKQTDKLLSLFMTRSVENLRSIKNTRERIGGVNVKLWNESGLFYALAGRSPLL